MTALAHTCASKWGPYECGAGEWWLGTVAQWVFALIGLASLVAIVWSWAAGRRRPWNRERARRRWADERRERGLAELDRRERERQRAEPREVYGPPPARRWDGPAQPW